MNLNQLKAFCILARTLHYSQAAELLEITQPSLSRMITGLEQELGADLFERVGRNITLSKQGRLFYSYIHRGIDEIDNGVAAVKDMMTPGYGTIDFAFIYALSPTYIPGLIRKFIQIENNKNIHFQFYQMNSCDIVRKIKNGTCDMGLCSFIDGESMVDFRPIVMQEYKLMVSKEHPLARKKTVTLEEAGEYDFILPLDKTSYIEQKFRNAGITPKVISRVEEDHAAAALVSINLGIAIIPGNKILEQYGVRLIPFENPMYRKFYMVSARNRKLTPAAEKFYQFLLEESKGELPIL